MSSIFALSGRVYEAITDELEVARLAMVADTDADPEKRTAAIARLGRAGRFADPAWRPSALAKNTGNGSESPAPVTNEATPASQPVTGEPTHTEAAPIPCGDLGSPRRRCRFDGAPLCKWCKSANRPDRIAKNTAAITPPAEEVDHAVHSEQRGLRQGERDVALVGGSAARSGDGQAHAGLGEAGDRVGPAGARGETVPRGRVPADVAGGVVSPTGPASSHEVATGGAGADNPSGFVSVPIILEGEFVPSPNALWSATEGVIDLRLRQNYCGSSDAPRILNASPHGGPLDVFLDKCLPAEESDEPEARHLAVGKRLQRPIFEEVAALRGLVPLGEEVEVYDPARPWLRAHVDFTATDVDGAVYIVECKATSTFARAWQGLDSEEIPPAVLVQTYFQRALFDLRFPKMAGARIIVGRFKAASLDIVAIDVPYDEELGHLILDKCDEFWQRHVVGRTPPPLDGSDASKTYLRRRFPKSNGHTRPPLPEELALADLLRDATRRAKDAAEDVARLRAKLAASIGDFDGIEGLATLRDGAAVSWKAVAEEFAARLVDLDATFDGQAVVKQNTKPRGRSLRLLGEKGEGEA